MSGVLTRRKSGDAGFGVKYTPCSKDEHTDDELEEIAIVGKNDEIKSEYPDDAQARVPSVTANGPRVLPGIGVYHSPSVRTKLIGERLSSTGTINLSSPIYSGKVVEQKSRSTSKQSLLDIVSTKLDRVKSKKRLSREDTALMRKTKSNSIITSRGIRKQRKKDIEEKFGRKSIIKHDRLETSTTSSDKDGCKWTFVFDPSGRLSYWWAAVVSVAYLYNFWVIIYRYAFQEINSENIAIWFTLDYTFDLIYILDIAFHFRTGYLEEGVLQTDSTKLRLHYMNRTMFYIDCLCLLPLDFLYLSIGFRSILRCFRLVKVYTFWAFLDKTERHTNYPNLVRTLSLLHYLLALFHWNACLYYIVVTKIEDNSTNTWQFPKDDGQVIKQYLHALYWSTLTLTTIGNLPMPRTIGDYLFVIFELIFGLLLFATVLGHIASIVASVSAARKDFQAKLDGVKTYMTLRRVPLRLQDRVIKWFDYLWMCNKSTDEEKTLSLLPDKLKAEIAIHVHLDTLKRVEIFQNTEAGFLCELVLRLRPVLYSPGDYICRKDEVGKEMYIVNRGRLQVVADNGKTILATLKPGSYFGEISILNMGTAGNRRTASVRSVGYSDLFCLSKENLWDVLKEYPAARVKLEAIAVKRLERYKKAPLEKLAIARSKSTPGMIESSSKIPLQAMMIQRHHTLPTGILTPSTMDPSCTHSLQSGTSRSDNEIIGSDESERRGLTGDIPPDPCDITASMTISSVTSYATDSPPQKSPMCSDISRTGYTPPSPRVFFPGVVFSTAPSPTIINSDLQTTPANVSQSHLTCPTFPYSSNVQSPSLLIPYCASSPYSPVSPAPYPASSSSYQSVSPAPYCASPFPPASPSYIPSTNNLGSSQLNISQPSQPFSNQFLSQQHSPIAPMNVQHSPVAPTNVIGQTVASSGGLPASRDQSQDVMVQEITRLRQRLASLETENATMSMKLNQQQWEVEHRLAEIEMHICGSDSVGSSGSPEGEQPDVNKESII